MYIVVAFIYDFCFYFFFQIFFCLLHIKLYTHPASTYKLSVHLTAKNEKKKIFIPKLLKKTNNNCNEMKQKQNHVGIHVIVEPEIRISNKMNEMNKAKHIFI